MSRETENMKVRLDRYGEESLTKYMSNQKYMSNYASRRRKFRE